MTEIHDGFCAPAPSQPDSEQVRTMLDFLQLETEFMTKWEKKFIAGLRPLPLKHIRGAKLDKVKEIFVETAERKRRKIRPQR